MIRDHAHVYNYGTTWSHLLGMVPFSQSKQQTGKYYKHACRIDVILTPLSRPLKHVAFVFPYTVLSAISFFESRQETGNYMELTRVDNFTMLGSGVSERCNGGDEQASLVTVVAQSVELAAGTT